MAFNLIQRHRGNANTYKDGDTYRLVLGGTSNHQNFDQDDHVWLPSHLRHNEADNIGAGFVRHRNGPMWVDVNLNLGAVRYYPVRGTLSKYIEIKDPVPPTAFTVNQLADGCVEYYIDYPDYRVSFIVNDLGVKTLITLNPGYLGDGTFELGYRLVGLTLQEGDVYDGTTKILSLPPAAAWSLSNPFDVKTVGEVYANDSVNIGVDLTGMTLPVVIDPTLGPDNDTIGILLSDSAPTSNYIGVDYGGAGTLNTTQWSHSVWGWDISALPALGVLVTSASATFTKYTVNTGYASHTYALERQLHQDLVESELTWNIYKTGSDWLDASKGGVGTGDTSATNRITSGYAGAATWTWNGLGPMIQNEYDANGNVLFLMTMFVDGFPTHPGFQGYVTLYTHRNVTPSNRPTLTIEYTVTSSLSAGCDMRYNPWMQNLLGIR